jgi:sporulation protein YlmC with PRC-barrel domain
MEVSKLWLKQSKLAVVAAAVGFALAGGAQQADDRARENANRAQTGETQIARAEAGMQTLEQYLESKPLRVSKLLGMELQNRSGDNLGEVHEVARAATPGQDMQLIMQIGGVGADDKLVAIPFDDIQISADGDELYTNRTREQLAAAPAVMLDERTASSTARRGAGGAGEPSRSTQPGAPGGAGAGGANAGGAAPGGAAAGGAGAGQRSTAAAGASLNEQRVGDLIGVEVLGSDGDQVGEVDDIVISMAGADDLRAVLQVGGVAGIGEKRVSLPLRQLTIERAADGEPNVRVAMDVESLERLPEFEYEEDTAAL